MACVMYKRPFPKEREQPWPEPHDTPSPLLGGISARLSVPSKLSFPVHTGVCLLSRLSAPSPRRASPALHHTGDPTVATDSHWPLCSPSPNRCGLMFTLTTNLAIWMAAVVDESVHQAHSLSSPHGNTSHTRLALECECPLQIHPGPVAARPRAGCFVDS